MPVNQNLLYEKIKVEEGIQPKYNKLEYLYNSFWITYIGRIIDSPQPDFDYACLPNRIDLI